VFSSECLGRDYSDWLAACKPYRETVEEILTSEELSTDYYYLMVAESKCTIKARSNKGAQGFWQLMPSTSKHYGCHNPDELECATKAAVSYLKRLESQFKTFDDVIAGYNMGGHNFKNKGITKEALGLIKRVKELKKQDLKENENG
jgi:membrane-bound lytic murein transglycosylase MltF